MKSLWRKLSSSWLVAALCASLVLAAGSRLIWLSLKQQAAQQREAAERLAAQDAGALHSQLQALLQLAQQRVERAAAAAPGAPSPSTPDAAARNAFWLSSDGRMLGSPPDRDTAAAIAAAWRGPPGEGAGLIGPIRQNNRWLVSARAPLRLPQGTGINVELGWSVVYRDVNELLSGARLNELRRSGFDFQLLQTDAATGRSEAFASSTSVTLKDPVVHAVALPAPSAASRAWQLALRPHTGWFPASALVIDLSLLALATWLVALGIRDSTRHLQQMRTALAVSRRRLQRSQTRLTQEVELRERLQRSFDHAHYHDAFTGLPNRHYFLDQLDRALREMRGRPDHAIAAALVAVDRFKVVTDTFGHSAGDELMVQITRLFDEALSAHEHVLARWSDDIFALLLLEMHGADALPEAARSLQQSLQAPIELRRHRVAVASLMGATYVDSGLRRTEEVMREADIALSGARARGVAFAAYSASMQRELLQLVSVEGDLHAALEREEFRLLFQPIVELRANRVVGVEALLRWLHPAYGLLPPARFLSFAEEAGLIVPITRWIVLRACELSRDWRARLPENRPFYISVNLSPASLLDAQLGDYVAEVLRFTGTPAAALKFELTENGLISNVRAARSALDRLHSMGIELMLDDFGSGYSSLSHLQVFPFDYVKIDGPFDGRSSSQREHETLARAMTQVASTLGLKTIAELVETTNAVEALQHMGCQYAQGNVFGEPVEAEQAVQQLRAQVLHPSDARAERVAEEASGDSPTMILPMIEEAGR